ncbi:hybrid sensor histidine kinase/response regulator [Natronobeatus ordinarius]|uniref:hybrid sensor histidine kinase/response regulator n=1 Tax=Natronobeatus ordinarius TaxID=2963433 RepID=UPI0020CDD9DF|nr:PAS domain S-box protein [Natronobeatus ordinarius]
MADTPVLKVADCLGYRVQEANGASTADQGRRNEPDAAEVLVVSDDHEQSWRIGSRVAATDEPITVETATVDALDDRFDGDGPNCVVSVTSTSEPSPAGLDVLERVRRHDPELPVVLVAGDGVAVDPLDALEAGVTDVFEGPLDERRAPLLARRVRNYAERHRCERAERRLESLFQHSPDAIIVHDEAGAILEANDRACESLGYDHEELLELTVQDVEVGIDHDELDKLWATYEFGEPLTLEGRHRRADGSEFPVQVNLGRIQLPDGEQFLAIARDVTEVRHRECELEEARALYETLVEQSPDGVVIVQDGEYGFVNDEFTELTGRTESALLGRPFEEIIAPEHRELVLARYERRIRGESPPRRYDVDLVTGDGERVTTDVRISRIRYDGEPATLATHRDVTERRRHERELERYERIVENVPVGVYRNTPGDDGGFELVNPGMVELFDAADETALLERPVNELYDDPDERAAFSERLLEQGLLVDEELRLRTLEDEAIWVSVTALRVEEDGEVFFDGVIQDVTERKEAVAELREREAHLRQAQAVATLGSWYTDVTADEIRWSAAVHTIFGRSPEEGPLSHDEFLSFVHPDDRAFVDRAWEGALEGEPYDIEHRIVVDGGTRWVREKAEIEFDDEGQPRRAIGVVQDVTERRERERTLEDQHRRLEEYTDQIEFFNSLLRHDMLNGMTIVLGNAEFLLDSLPEDDDRYPYAEAVYERAGDVVELTQRVRSVLERLSDDHEPSLSPVDLATIVDERADALADSCPDAVVSVDAPSNAPVLADSLLADVLDNLVLNAVKHHDGDEPHVSIAVDRDSETTTLRVADDGPGVPDDLKERIFDRGETGATSAGTGFGLYFVDVMVSAYGGDVWVEDNDPSGAVFVVELSTA